MSDKKILRVSENAIAEAGFYQYKDAEGKAHPLVIEAGRLVYDGQKHSGAYSDADKISAYTIAKNVEFQSKIDGINGMEVKDEKLHHMINFEGLVDTVEIGGETYELKLTSPVF